MAETWPRNDVVHERLLLHARISLKFPHIARALAAFAFGVSPQAEMVVDAESASFRVGARPGCEVPLSRLVVGHPVNIFGRRLTHSFAAHAWANSVSCSMLDLLDDSKAVCEIAGVGRSVKVAISSGRPLKSDILREAANRIDIALLLLAGQVVSAEFSAAKTALTLVGATGEAARGMNAWVSEILDRIRWDVDADLATSVVRSVLPPVAAVGARERLAARARVAQALTPN